MAKSMSTITMTKETRDKLIMMKYDKKLPSIEAVILRLIKNNEKVSK